MVLHHIAQCAIGIIVIRPAIDTDGLGDADLYVVDMVVIPLCFENHIGKA